MARTSSDFSTVRSSTRRPTGTIIAPPTPCRMRAPTKPKNEVLRPHRIEPSMKTAIAIRNTCRAPNRSAIQPLAGMNTARLRRYDEIARLRRIGFSPSDRAIAGKAVASTVESRFSMNSAVATISGTRIGRGMLEGMMQRAIGGGPGWRLRHRKHRTHGGPWPCVYRAYAMPTARGPARLTLNLRLFEALAWKLAIGYGFFETWPVTQPPIKQASPYGAW